MDLVNKIVNRAKTTGKYIAKPVVPLAFAATLYTGCAASASQGRTQEPAEPQEKTEQVAPTPIRNYPSGHVYGTEFRARTQDDHPHRTEELGLHGDSYFIRQIEESEQDSLWRDYTLPQRWALFEDHVHGNKTNILRQKKEYVPVLAKYEPGDVPEKDPGDKSPWLNAIRLTDTGPLGIKVNIIRPENMGEPFVFTRTEQDLKRKVKTINIRGTEYYAPEVRDGRIDKTGSRRDFFLTPYRGTEEWTDYSTGQVDLESEAGFYILLEESLVDDYLSEFIEADREPEPVLGKQDP